ncbi:unnamed protein product [Lampetra fluviatilis]
MQVSIADAEIVRSVSAGESGKMIRDARVSIKRVPSESSRFWMPNVPVAGTRREIGNKAAERSPTQP